MSASASCLIDLFCRPRYTKEQIQELRRVIMHHSAGSALVPGEKGCWDKIMEYRYEPFMPKYITRLFHYVIYNERASSDLVYMHVLFFVMIAHEYCIQRVIIKQLERSENYDRLSFFQNVFIQQARLYIQLLFEYPYTEENSKYALTIVASELRVAWSLQLDIKYKLTRDTEKLTIQRDIEMAKKNKLAAKHKEKTGRKKRRRSPDKHDIQAINEEGVVVENNDEDDDEDEHENGDYGDDGDDHDD